MRGQWRASRTANAGIVRLLTSGAPDLAPERGRSFPRDAVDDAVTHAGPFDRAALTPRTG
ncbi:hypothetical protein [Streptomyces sp. NPDC046859]|uniref:hypothetical protein n=1 Tax=Streptomyces sp. NPDC046859 TaxID=3155734 RepID=UPI0033D119FF